MADDILSLKEGGCRVRDRHSVFSNWRPGYTNDIHFWLARVARQRRRSALVNGALGEKKKKTALLFTYAPPSIRLLYLLRVLSVRL